MGNESSAIRNVAVVGHRGTGKTSLVEALLFQAEAINRLGSVEQGSTVADWEEDEHNRQMSLSAALVHADWKGNKLNIIDTPGDPGFQADTLAALRVLESVINVVSGVAGVEVHTKRRWEHAVELQLAQLVFVNMLDRERADFYPVLQSIQAQLSNRCFAVQIPIGREYELSGVVDLLHQRAFMSPEGELEAVPVDIPDEVAERAIEYRGKLVDAVIETDEAVMERYLEGEEISGEELSNALKSAVRRREIFPVACGSATKNLGTTNLLDLIVEALPSPDEAPISDDLTGDGVAAFVFKTVADPFAGRINMFRVFGGTVMPDSTLINLRTRSKERVGQVFPLQGKEHGHADSFSAGDIGAVAKLKETVTGDLLLSVERKVELEPITFPSPVMSFAITPKTKGDEEKVATALRRLTEEDPTLVFRRDEQTGEKLLAGMSHVHVEVAIERMRQRFGAEVELHQPRVPYLETIRKESRARGRYKKQTGGRGQFGDCEVVLEPRESHEGYEFVDKIVGGSIPQSFRPAVDKGIQEAMTLGGLAGAPVQGVRVTLVDGQHHSVDSSEMAFKIAGSMAFKEAYQRADPVLLEPIMAVDVTVPDDAVGAINGDLSSRRGRVLGMEPAAGMTNIRAEVPMAEILTYSQSVTSLTGGRGNYTMSFLRYEEVPTQIAQKLIDAAKREVEGAKSS